MLTDGPWTECDAPDATVVVSVTASIAGIPAQVRGLHFLRPAVRTVHRLLLRQGGGATTIAQREIPEACFSTILMRPAQPAHEAFSIRSTLKQIPVDPAHAITLGLRAMLPSASNVDPTEHVITLNGLSKYAFSQGALQASVEILPADAAAAHVSLSNNIHPTAASDTGTATTPASLTEDWDALHRTFQLTGQESRLSGWYQFSGDASLQFADIRYSCRLIEINSDLSLIKLKGPVVVDWDGRRLTMGDAVIQVSRGLYRCETDQLQSE